MADFLNRTGPASVYTSARDNGNGEPITDTAGHIKTDSGIWVPMKGTEIGELATIASNIVETKELGSISFDEFTSGGSVTRFFPKALNRRAKKRVLVIFSTLDVSMNQQRLTMQDSLFSNTNRTAGSTTTTTQIVANNSCTQLIDGTIGQMQNSLAGIIDMPVDSLSISFTMGPTAPVRGEVKIGLIEVL